MDSSTIHQEKGALVKTVEKALIILESFAFEDEMGVSEIARKVEMDTSTTYRLLQTLSLYGYVEKNSLTNKYKMGLKVLELSHARLNNLDIKNLASPFLRALRDRTGETVYLMLLYNLLYNDEGMYIDRYDSEKSIRIVSEVGTREPLYCTSCGKSMLAYLPEEVVNNILRKKELVALTDNTIVDIDQLKEELARTRERGYAIDDREWDEDVRCIGAPIFSFDNQVLAAVSIAGPAYRISLEDLEFYAGIIKECANEISMALGSQKQV